MSCAAVLTHCSTVHFCVKCRVHRVVISVYSISVYNSKINSFPNLLLLEDSTVSYRYVDWRRKNGIFFLLHLSNIVVSGIDCDFTLPPLELKWRVDNVKLKGKVVSLRSIEALLGERRYSSYSSLTSAVEGGELSASCPGRSLLPGKEPPVPII
jgi:hypothetical protein